ncbi:unnamed protein product [Rhizophagus irregularis]|nr:unnamed protein product [Rhizophagus irregularis]
MEETVLKEPNYYINWLEKSIADEYLNYYEYSEFKSLKPIGNGSFGSIVRANWKNTGNFFAIKAFKNNCNTTLKELVNEIRLQKRVDFHENIIRFYGITKVENEKYSLVLEYANNANGKREEIIDNTPKEYSNLYTECWKYEPDERPNVQNVVSILYTLIFPKQDDIVIDTVNKEKENNQLIESIGTMDLNNELMSNTGLNLMDA